MNWNINKTFIAFIVGISIINVGSFGYLIAENRHTVDENCRANDRQNRILATLVHESLKGADNPPEELTDQQKNAVIVFRRQLSELRKPTCSR